MENQNKFKGRPIFSRLVFLLTILLLSCSVQEQPEKATDAPLPPTWRSYQKAQAFLDAGLRNFAPGRTVIFRNGW